MKISKENKVELFKSLASQPLYEVGVAYNMDRFYKNKVAIKNAVYKIYNDIRHKPEDYGLAIETVNLVVDAVQNRSAAPSTSLQVDNTKLETKELLGNIQGKTLRLLDRRLDLLSKSKKKLESVSLTQLGTLAGIIFDKNQIIKGEATQHVAVHAKIDKDMSPDQLIEFVQKTREGHFEENTKK